VHVRRFFRDQPADGSFEEISMDIQAPAVLSLNPEAGQQTSPHLAIKNMKNTR
jgi:hypothetical protein